jgi:hypothetical protein
MTAQMKGAQACLAGAAGFFQEVVGVSSASPPHSLACKPQCDLNHRSARFRGPAHAASAQARNSAIEKGAPWNGRDRVCARDKYKLEILGKKGDHQLDEDTKRQINTMTKHYSWILGGTRAAACRMSRGRCSLSLCAEPRHQVGGLAT